MESSRSWIFRSKGERVNGCMCVFARERERERERERLCSYVKNKPSMVCGPGEPEAAVERPLAPSLTSSWGERTEPLLGTGAGTTASLPGSREAG